MNKDSGDDIISNLTGGQIQEILDHFIHESIACIVRTSDAFDVQIIYLLTLCTKNKKRKISSLPREQFISMLSQYLVTDDIETKLSILANAKIERSFIYNFIVKYLKETEDYLPLYTKYLNTKTKVHKQMLDLKLKAIEKRVGNTRETLYQTINTARDYLNLAYEFRNSIVNNYIRLAYTQAKIFCKMKGPNFDFKDVYQNFLTIITKAIDKYDSSKGALTSYIKFWILNVQTNNHKNFGHEYGIAYSIPQFHKKHLTQRDDVIDSNFSVSLEGLKSSEDNEGELKDFIAGDCAVEETLVQEETLNILQYLAKCADIKGMARLYLDIGEYFSKKELAKMRRNMQKQLGLVHET